ncbi:uncharacterized protein LOC143003393 [Genypterus blacodes]|uniref:uncharacterized protein LOC143003393 n=1 Tax=Genypterus blacodes TaxID=154954 RepID=UPI003F767395
MQIRFLQHVVLASSLIVLAAAQNVIAGHSRRPTAPAEGQRMRVVNVREDTDNFGPTGDTAEGKVRRKRAWIFPGTLWCGTGSKAIGYEQLGMFESTDKCCREHDHCKHIIHSFTVKYGVFNPNFYTVSHCDCDQRFQQCLLGVNDTISSMVGYSFFNILRVPCFVLTQQRRCTEMYWWGMCKVAKEAPYAIFKNSLPYNSSVTTSNSGENTHNSSTSKGQHVTEKPLVSPSGKLPKGESRCVSKDKPRGDAFLRKRTKGKGCKRRRKPSTITSTQMPSVSMTNTTLPSILMPAWTIQKNMSVTLDQTTALSNVSKSNGSISERLGKNKGTRKNQLAYSTRRKQDPSQITTMSDLQTASTTQSMPSSTQAPTAVTTVKKTAKSRKDFQKQRPRCGSMMSVRGDTFQPRHENCPEHATSRSATVAPSTIRNAVNATTAQTHRISKTTDLPRRQTMKTLWNTSTTAVSIVSTQKTALLTQAAAPLHHDGEPQKHGNPFVLRNNSSQPITENELLCGSLRYLDECKYKIPPLVKKYDLHNMDSKTAYHCNCTSSLALQIESFKRPNILPFLLRDYVSQYCFKIPKERKRCNRKSCSGGFAKASDLLQALKRIEEKDAELQNSVIDRRRGIPIRLYKRCLRIVDPKRN